MNLYSTRRGEYDGSVVPDPCTTTKGMGRVSAVRVIQMPNGRFGLVRAAFRGQHWTERRVGDASGYGSEAEAERVGREITA